MVRLLLCLFITGFLAGSPAVAQNNWAPVGGTLSGAPTSIAISATGDIFVAVPNEGVFRSTDDGASWTQLPNPHAATLGPVYGFNYNYKGKGDLFVGGGFGLFRSSNNGDAWQQLRIQPTVGTDPVIVGFTFTTWGDIFLASNGSALWQSTDNGATWSEAGINNDITLYPSFVACSPKGKLFAGTSNAMYSTTDKGNSVWQSISGAMGSNVSFAFNSNGSEIIAGGTSGLFRSFDDGNSWKPLSPPGMGNLTYYSLAIASNGSIFEGTESLLNSVKAVSLSADSGTSWLDISSGLPSSLVYAFGVSRKGYVYAATDNGVFRYSQPTGVVRAISNGKPSAFDLGQNHPNPFFTSTRIPFSISEEVYATLKVYDVTGHEVAALANQQYQPGSYEAAFDGSGLPSGPYICRLTAGPFSLTRTLILLP